MILTAAGAGLVNVDLLKQRQLRFDAVPEPLGENLAGRVFQALDIVQAIVVQLSDQRLHNSFDLAKVQQVTFRLIDLASDDDIDAERVAMHPAALMPLGEGWEPVSCFKCKRF